MRKLTAQFESMLQYLAGIKARLRADLQYFINGCDLLLTCKGIGLMVTMFYNNITYQRTGCVRLRLTDFWNFLKKV